MTLLENAKDIKVTKPRKNITDEEIELAIAWAGDEVTIGQVSTALGYSKTQNTSNFLAMALREAVRRNVLVKGEKK